MPANLEATSKFGARVGEVEERPWGMRDFVLFDPAGVMWRIAHNIPRKPPSPST